MTGRSNKQRINWPAETRARALAIAEDRGNDAASAETGVPVGTLRAWRKKARDTPAGAETHAAEVEVGRALEAELTGTGRLTDEELGELQRATARRYRAALEAGDHLAMQRLATPVGVLEDKLSKREAEARERRGDALDNQGMVARVIERRDGMAQRAFVMLARADVDDLRVELEYARAQARQAMGRVRMLATEMLRRRRGEPTVFGFDAVEDFQRFWRPVRKGDRVQTWSPPLAPSPSVPVRPSPPSPPVRKPVAPAEDVCASCLGVLPTHYEGCAVVEPPAPVVEDDVVVAIEEAPRRRRRVRDPGWDGPGWDGPRRGRDPALDK